MLQLVIVKKVQMGYVFKIKPLILVQLVQIQLRILLVHLFLWLKEPILMIFVQNWIHYVLIILLLHVKIEPVLIFLVQKNHFKNVKIGWVLVHGMELLVVQIYKIHALGIQHLIAINQKQKENVLLVGLLVLNSLIVLSKQMQLIIMLA